jgi:hypothetical protein
MKIIICRRCWLVAEPINRNRFRMTILNPRGRLTIELFAYQVALKPRNQMKSWER